MSNQHKIFYCVSLLQTRSCRCRYAMFCPFFASWTRLKNCKILKIAKLYFEVLFSLLEWSLLELPIITALIAPTLLRRCSGVAPALKHCWRETIESSSLFCFRMQLKKRPSCTSGRMTSENMVDCLVCHGDRPWVWSAASAREDNQRVLKEMVVCLKQWLRTSSLSPMSKNACN